MFYISTETRDKETLISRNRGYVWLLMCTEETGILNAGNRGQMWCQKLNVEWSAVILSPPADAFSFPKGTRFSNGKHAKQCAVDWSESIQESIKIHSLMSYPYCWVSKHNSVNLTSVSSVMLEMVLMCYTPTENHGTEKRWVQRFWQMANGSQIVSAWQNGALPMEEGNMS